MVKTGTNAARHSTAVNKFWYPMGIPPGVTVVRAMAAMGHTTNRATPQVLFETLNSGCQLN